MLLDVQVPEEGTSNVLEDCPLKVEYGNFGISGASWRAFRSRHPDRMLDFVRSRHRKVYRTSLLAEEFWRSFRPSDRQRNLVRGVLLEPKEEPLEEPEEQPAPRYRYFKHFVRRRM